MASVAKSPTSDSAVRFRTVGVRDSPTTVDNSSLSSCW